MDRVARQGRNIALNHPRVLDREILLESYGVIVKIQASDADLLSEAVETARKALVGKVKILESGEAEHVFEFSLDEAGTLFLFRNGEQLALDTLRRRFFKFFNSMLRITVAEHA